MALTNRLGVVNWALENDVITLSSSLANQKKLEEATGMGFFEFVASMDDARSNPLVTLATLFSFLQVGSDYSADDIFKCFFADLSAYGDGFTDLQTKLINHMLGQKEAAIIEKANKGKEAKGNE